jgi:segregation and condensation protein B
MELKFVLESLLFAAQKPLSPQELREVLHRAAQEEDAIEAVRALQKTDPQTIEEALGILQDEHRLAARSYRLVCVAGAWQFVSEPDYAPWLRAFLGAKNRPSRLSQPALETLAIVAYRQPITRAEMEQIRGVAVDGVLSSLVERGLIEQVGRAEVVGRPMQYGTTPAFLEYFGLPSLDGLPDASELRRIPVQRPDSLLTLDPGLATAPESPKLEESPLETLSLPLGSSPASASASGAADLPATPAVDPAPESGPTGT